MDQPPEPVADEQGPFVPGDSVDDRYLIVRRLKAGGVGVVYEARHLFTHASVALKALFHRASDHHVRMRQEAQAQARVRHPFVVPVFDGGVTRDGVVWYVMELLHGRTLREELMSCDALVLERALRFGAQIAFGCAAAHAHEIIHRDIKPENIFVVAESDTIRVLDFGISKLTGAAAEQARIKTTDKFRLIATEHYASPEHLRGERVDARSDIYSVGVVIDEMISGRNWIAIGPGKLDFPDRVEVGMKQIHVVPEPLKERAPGVPDYVSDIVMRALAKRRGERHESMITLAWELEEARRTYLIEIGAAELIGMGQPEGYTGVSRMSPPAPQVAFSAPGLPGPVLKTEEIPSDERPDRKPSSSAPAPQQRSRSPIAEPAAVDEPAASEALAQRSTVRLPTADTEPSAVMDAPELAGAKQTVKIVPHRAPTIEDPLARWTEPRAEAIPVELERRPLTTEGCLVCGAIRFASLAPEPTSFERALRAFCATELDDPARMGRLHFVLMAATAATQRGRAFVRGALAQAAQASPDEYAEIDLLLRKFVVCHSEPAERAKTGQDKLCLIALGAAELVEPEHQHARAREALAALSAHTNKRERDAMFIVSVLASFARTPPELHAAPRGALLAMLLGSDEDAEVARGELAEFVRTAKRMSTLAQSPTNPGKTRMSARELERVPMPWLDPAQPEPPLPLRDATHATPGAMTTPAEPVRDAPTDREGAPRRRALDPRIVIAVALVSTLVVVAIAMLVRPRPSATTPESATSRIASAGESARESAATAEPPGASAQPSSSASAEPARAAASATTAHPVATAAPSVTESPVRRRAPPSPPKPKTTAMPRSGL